MDNVTTVGHAHAHADHEHEMPFWQRYVFSQDHKVIGIQYAITALLFLLFGFTLMMIMRWQLAYVGQPIPFIGGLFGDANAPEEVCDWVMEQVPESMDSEASEQESNEEHR